MKRAGLRKTLKYLLPHGVVEIARNIRRLGAIGIRLRPGQWWRSDLLAHQAEASGLTLFPPGQLPDFKCVVDVGANSGQWSSMLLDCIRLEKLILIEPEPNAFAQLEKNFRYRSAVQLHKVAVGDKIGSTKFLVTRDTTGASVLAPRDEMRELLGHNLDGGIGDSGFDDYAGSVAGQCS
jgi:hypothetical protein